MRLFIKQCIRRLVGLFSDQASAHLPDNDQHARQRIILTLEIQLKQAKANERIIRRDRDRKEKELNELYLFINGFEQRHETEMDELRTALHDALEFTGSGIERTLSK